MTEKVITCVVVDRAASVMAVMVSKHLRHMPVVQDAKFVNMVNMRDFLQPRLDEVQSDAEAMRERLRSADTGVSERSK